MSAHQAVFPVAAMARVLGVSQAGFHAWRRRPVSAHAVADAALLKRIRTIHAGSRESYGAPRVHAELRAGGEKHGRKRDAYDNAMCESFFATLECELLERRRFTSKIEAKMACFSFIEGWYNPVRLHSALGYRSPIAYEAAMEAVTREP
jgi:transposase InsO family protein